MHACLPDLVVTVHVYIMSIYHGFSNLHNVCLTRPLEKNQLFVGCISILAGPRFLPVKTRGSWPTAPVVEGLQLRLRLLLGSDDDLGGGALIFFPAGNLKSDAS